MYEFRHPHIDTRIVDNSYVNENYSDGSGKSLLFQPYFSSMGEDNVIKKYTSLKDFIVKNGKPVFKLHGQAIYNLTAWLRKAPVYGIRLMPEDATYANMVLTTAVQKTAGDGQNGATVGTAVKSIQNLTNGAEFLTNIKNLANADGEKTLYNFIGFRVKGRGVYGKDYSIKLKLNNPKSKATDFRCYDLTIFSTSDTGAVQALEGPFSVSLSPDAINSSGESLFIENVINSYSEFLKCEFDEEAYDNLIIKLHECIPNFNASKFDFVFGKDEEMKNYEHVTIDENSVKIDQASGVGLLEGSDGQLGTATTQAKRLEIMNALYKKAFTGEICSSVMNKKAYPFDVILDASFPITVKEEMKRFCETRQDVFPYFDCGINSSFSSTAACNFRKTQFDVDTYIGGLFSPSRIVRDPFGTKNIEVTFTYTLAEKIPEHDNSLGVQFPIAGPNYGKIGRLSDSELSFNPDDFQQEDLYNSQVNYVVQDVDGEVEIGSQLTMQKKTSSLSDINNVRSLFKIVRQVEHVAGKYKFEFADSITLASFQGELNAISPIWINNRACSSLILTVYQNEYDKSMKTAKVKVELVFNNTIEKIIIDVNVGR